MAAAAAAAASVPTETESIAAASIPVETKMIATAPATSTPIEMELIAAAVSEPVEADVFDFPCSSPYVTAPSSPKHPDSPSSSPYSTAPPSPAAAHRLTESSLPMRPSDPDRAADASDDDEDFAFEFRGHLLDGAFLYAEELFDCGVIRPLRPLTRLQLSSQLAESARDGGTGPNENSLFAPRKFNFEYPKYESTAAERAREETATRRKSLKTSSFKGSSCSSCSSFKGCRKWRFRDWLSFRAGSAGPAARKEGDERRAGHGRFGAGGPPGPGRRGSGLDRRFERSGSERKSGPGEPKGKGETTSCKQGLWECMRRFNHGEAHGLVKGIADDNL